MMIRRAFLATVAGLLSATSAFAAEFDMKISHMFPSTHFIQTLVLEPWAKSIEEKSGGRVKFQIFAAGSAYEPSAGLSNTGRWAGSVSVSRVNLRLPLYQT